METKIIDLNKCSIGIELGSTRIKAVLIDNTFNVLASGSHVWENEYKDGYWTYSLMNIEKGIKDCYSSLKLDFFKKYHQVLTHVASIGISGMMHGYLVLDENDHLLTPFRTWRNNTTNDAATLLSNLFDFNIPQRWSIAHLYQAYLNKETHIKDIKYLTTLAGYIHYRLTGEKVVGIGEASGIFPIDNKTNNYNEKMAKQFFELTNIDIYKLFPKVLLAGQEAGKLTKYGALFLDPDGDLKEGIPLCPPEGDAGTGMVSTNSIKIGTGNISVGTSDFAMIVTDKYLRPHPEIDMVTTPTGDTVAMVHCNNCTSDINAWVNLFSEFASLFDLTINKNDLYTKLFRTSLEGDDDYEGIININYFSGENITNIKNGFPLLVRNPQSKFSLANFMRAQLLSSLATLKIGLDILTQEENIKIDKIYAHGGLVKTPSVGQTFISSAIGCEVSIMDNAAEGGAFGIALLAQYLEHNDVSLVDYLTNCVFKNNKEITILATKEQMEGFKKYLLKYKEIIKDEKLIEEVY